MATEFDLPLHLKQLPRRADWERCAECIIPELRNTWEYARACLTDAAFIRRQTQGHCPPQLSEALLSKEDIKRFIGHGIIEENVGEVLGTCRVFSVLELTKARRRMIVEPWLNEILTDAGVVKLPQLQEVIDMASLAGAATLDFMAYYNQFALPEDCRSYYCFSFDGVAYIMCVIATFLLADQVHSTQVITCNAGPSRFLALPYTINNHLHHCHHFNEEKGHRDPEK